MEKEIDEKIIEKALALRETKSKSEILKLFPDDKEELSEMLDIISWITEEKESIIAPRTGLTKALKDVSVLAVPAAPEVSDEAVSPIVYPKKEPTFEAPIASPFVALLSKYGKVWIGGGVALVAVLIFVFTKSSAPISVQQASPQTLAVAHTFSSTTPAIASADISSLFAQVDSEQKKETAILSNVDDDTTQADPVQSTDVSQPYNSNAF